MLDLASETDDRSLYVPSQVAYDNSARSPRHPAGRPGKRWPSRLSMLTPCDAMLTERRPSVVLPKCASWSSYNESYNEYLHERICEELHGEYASSDELEMAYRAVLRSNLSSESSNNSSMKRSHSDSSLATQILYQHVPSSPPPSMPGFRQMTPTTKRARTDDDVLWSSWACDALSLGCAPQLSPERWRARGSGRSNPAKRLRRGRAAQDAADLDCAFQRSLVL